MTTSPHVADLGGAFAVVVPDWHSYNHMLGIYCGVENYDDSLPRGTDLYILCHDQGRAEELHARLPRDAFHLAREIAIGRCPTYGSVARDLVARGYAVACDSLGPDCDDARLKALHPPPLGPVIDFEWMPAKKRYRMRCLFTGKDGSTSSQRIVLTDGPDWDEQIARGYRRFARKEAPAAATLSVLPHVAAAVSRLDWYAAQRLALWRAEIEKAGIDCHDEVSPLLLSSASLDRPGDLVSIEIKGTKGSYLLSSKCTYRGGTIVSDRLLDLRADLPETVLAAIVGLPASAIWGDEDLATLRVARNAKAKGHGFMLEGDVVPLPTPSPEYPDEAAARDALRELKVPDDMWADGTFLYLMSRLSASVRLHVYQTLLIEDKNRTDTRIDISPWLPDANGEMVLARNHLSLQHVSSRFVSMSDVVP